MKPQEHRALPETWPHARHRAGLHESSWGRCAEGHIHQLPGLGETHPSGYAQEMRGVWPGWWVLLRVGFCSAEQTQSLGQALSRYSWTGEGSCVNPSGLPPPPRPPACELSENHQYLKVVSCTSRSLHRVSTWPTAALGTSLSLPSQMRKGAQKGK